MDKENKNPKTSGAATDPPARSSETEELYRKLGMSVRQHKPTPEAIAAAVEAAQRLAAEADAEYAAEDAVPDSAAGSTVICNSCGYRNRKGNKFCGRCGAAAGAEPIARAERQPEHPPGTAETHHYHHHYHHHYFPGGQEGSYPRAAAEPAREERLRPNAALRGEMSRAEAGVRHVTQEWMVACNTKHLDDLLDLYVSDALVLRSNTPPIRGTAAVREFFFGALGAGLGEVELDPLRVEVAGDLAYEAGRCKALIPSSTGKRREERGKYLWVCARQSNGEWKLAADCWSSDLTLSTLEGDVPANIAVKTGSQKKSP